MSTLGGSIFTYNVLKFDYCIREALASLLDVCDEVVVLDAESTDGTLDVLKEIASSQPKLRVVEGAQWEVGTHYDRLAILANQAKSHLKSDWHFMLQADEVIHESSFDTLRQLVQNPVAPCYQVRRYNLYGDFNHHVSLTSSRKPCNDTPVRLGRIDLPAVGDAESLQWVNCSSQYVDRIILFHYGYVRTSRGLIEKTIDMQSWFHGPGSKPDERVVEMKNKDGVFDPFKIIPRSEISPNPIAHPKYMVEWIQEREHEKVGLLDDLSATRL